MSRSCLKGWVGGGSKQKAPPSGAMRTLNLNPFLAYVLYRKTSRTCGLPNKVGVTPLPQLQPALPLRTINPFVFLDVLLDERKLLALAQWRDLCKGGGPIFLSGVLDYSQRSAAAKVIRMSTCFRDFGDGWGGYQQAVGEAQGAVREAVTVTIHTWEPCYILTQTSRILSAKSL